MEYNEFSLTIEGPDRGFFILLISIVLFKAKNLGLVIRSASQFIIDTERNICNDITLANPPILKILLFLN